MKVKLKDILYCIGEEVILENKIEETIFKGHKDNIPSDFLDKDILNIDRDEMCYELIISIDSQCRNCTIAYKNK